MNLITVLWSMAAAAALTLALVHLLVWAFDRTARANLMFSIIALAVAAMAPTELGMMYASSPEEYGYWVRWFHVPLFFAIVGMVLFVRLHLGTGRAWLAWTVIGMRSVVLAGNFLLPQPNFTWREIHSLNHVPFLGENVAAIAQATVGSGQWLATASVILFTVFVTDAAVALWRRGSSEQRGKAVVVGGGIVAFVVISIGQTQTVVWGIAHMPVLMSPPFVITVGAMAFDLSRDILVSRRAQLESEELRRELALAGRVSLLGLLASALAHELSQPLGAILRNAETAEILLREPAPDIEELRAIVTDVLHDDRRAAAVIDRLRALLKRRSVELHPIALDAMVQDVIALVRASASARHTALDCVVAANLPTAAGDRVHLSQVLLNLIVNGMDAMDEAQEQVRRVTVGARAVGDGMIEVWVTDAGRGLQSQEIAKVFDAFFTTKSNGMGMGLPICRTIIEAHGGRIWAENNADGRGATFRFTLPAATRGSAMNEISPPAAL
jgi:signal transduction histidine kinase